MEKISKEYKAFTKDEKTSIVQYSAILLGVHARLVIEGYFLEGGKIWNIFKVGTPICEVVWED